VCDVGYDTADCSACAAGFVGSGGVGCQPSDHPDDVSAVSALLTLRLTADFATTAGQAGSATRAAFVQGLYTDLAAALALPRSRLNVTDLQPGSVIASVSILPPPAGGSDVSAAIAAVALSALIANASSALYSGSVTRLLAAPGSGAPAAASFNFVAAAPAAAHDFQAVLGSGLTLSWSVRDGALAASLDYSGAVGPNTWFAVGFSAQASMVGADAVVFQPGANPQVQQFTVSDRSLSGLSAVPPASSTLSGTSARALGGGAVGVTFTRPLAAGSYPGARAISDSGASIVIYAVGGPDHTTLGYHDGGNGVASVDFSTGSVSVLADRVAPLRVAHGVLMTLGWGVLLPLGAAVARFTKGVKPTSGPAAFWFRCHWIMQASGLVVAAAGLLVAIVMVAPGPHFSGAHHACGLVVMLLGLLQPINAVLRSHPPAKGAAPSVARVVWAMAHKGSGYCSLLLGVAAILLGLKQIRAPIGLSVAYGVAVAAGALLWLWREVRLRGLRPRAVVTTAPPSPGTHRPQSQGSRPRSQGGGRPLSHGQPASHGLHAGQRRALEMGRYAAPPSTVASQHRSEATVPCRTPTSPQASSPHEPVSVAAAGQLRHLATKVPDWTLQQQAAELAPGPEQRHGNALSHASARTASASRITVVVSPRTAPQGRSLPQLQPSDADDPSDPAPPAPAAPAERTLSSRPESRSHGELSTSATSSRQLQAGDRRRTPGSGDAPRGAVCATASTGAPRSLPPGPPKDTSTPRRR